MTNSGGRVIDFRQRQTKAKPARAATLARRVISGGVPECRACNDNGTIEIYPARIGEHSPTGVRADLKAGWIILCVCAGGEFWRTMLDLNEGDTIAGI